MNHPEITIPDHIMVISETLHKAGYSCYLVGGSIRDILANRQAIDHDLATDATPQRVMELFDRSVPTGIKYGTVTVLIGDTATEITTFRLESDYLDRRHPETIRFASTIFEDLSRRDFTFNAIAYDIATRELLDPFDGIKDLERGILRAVGSASERIREDPLRIIRCFRFTVFGSMDRELEDAVRENSPLLKHVSPERITTEFQKALATDHASKFFSLMHEYGTLKVIIPELYRPSSGGCDKNWPDGYHSMPPERRVDQACKMMALMGEAEPMARLSSLFSAMMPEKPRQVSDVLRRLKFSNMDIDEVISVLFNAKKVMGLGTDEEVRWFVFVSGHSRQGAVALALAATGQSLADSNRPEAVHAKRVLEMEVKCPEPLVSGHDIMECLGLETGKKVGDIKNELHRFQVCNDICDRQEMIRILHERYPCER